MLRRPFRHRDSSACSCQLSAKQQRQHAEIWAGDGAVVRAGAARRQPHRSSVRQGQVRLHLLEGSGGAVNITKLHKHIVLKWRSAAGGGWVQVYFSTAQPIVLCQVCVLDRPLKRRYPSRKLHFEGVTGGSAGGGASGSGGASAAAGRPKHDRLVKAKDTARRRCLLDLFVLVDSEDPDTQGS